MYCKYCGNKIDDSKFCSKCGKSREENTSNNITNNEFGKDRAIASLVIGILSLLFGGAFVPLPIIGLILGYSYKGKCVEKTVGIVLNIIGLVISIISFVIVTFIFTLFLNELITGDIINNFEIDDIGQWEEYSKYVIDDDYDITTNIIGSWKELSETRSFIVFKENEYHFYGDLNDREKDYSYGTYTIYDETEELYSKSKIINTIIDKMTKNNLYIIKLNPITEVKDGIEVNVETDEDKLLRTLFISVHDNITELSMSGGNENTIKHYYKVLE